MEFTWNVVRFLTNNTQVIIQHVNNTFFLNSTPKFIFKAIYFVKLTASVFLGKKEYEGDDSIIKYGTL